MPLIDMRHIYKETNRGFWGDYQPMLSSFGQVVIQENFGEYQGDTIAVIIDKGRHGVVRFGWGSCSGCDALQYCDTYEELNNLAQNIYNSILWFDTKKEAAQWFENHYWKADHISLVDQEGAVQDFVARAVYILERGHSYPSERPEAPSINLYQDATARTQSPDSNVTNFCFGLIGETGEVIDLVKKHLYHKHPREEVREKILDELGDVMWYICRLAATYDIRMSEVLVHNLDKLQARYPDGFSPERSIKRENGDG